MKNFIKIFLFYFILSSLSIAQSYIIIQSGNSIFVPMGSRFCTDNIIVEDGANYITQDKSGTCENTVVKRIGKILPHIELISFTAGIDANKNIMIKWETVAEINNYGFNIERKQETGDWTKIGFVASNGNSNLKVPYTFIDKSSQPDVNYDYRLLQINSDNSFSVLNTIKVKASSPEEYFLSQNFPNPFNPTTKIKYSIPPSIDANLSSTINVQIKVYDVLGKEVATLINEDKSAGKYEITFNAANFPSGIYFYKFQAGNFTQTKKMILLR